MSTETLPTPDPATVPVVKRHRPVRWLFWRMFWACAAATMFIGVFFRTGFEEWLKSTPRGQQASKIGVQLIDDVARNLGVAEKKDETAAKSKQGPPEPTAKKADNPVKPVPPAMIETAATGTPGEGTSVHAPNPPGADKPSAKPPTEPSVRESRRIDGLSKPTDLFPPPKN